LIIGKIIARLLGYRNRWILPVFCEALTLFMDITGICEALTLFRDYKVMDTCDLGRFLARVCAWHHAAEKANPVMQHAYLSLAAKAEARIPALFGHAFSCGAEPEPNLEAITQSTSVRCDIRAVQRSQLNRHLSSASAPARAAAYRS